MIDEIELGTRVTRAADPHGNVGWVIAVPATVTGNPCVDRYEVEWPDGTSESLTAGSLAVQALTALLDISHMPHPAAEWTVDVATVAIPLGARGQCGHSLTICEYCAESWCNDYVFLDPWPADWTTTPSP